MIFGLFDTPIGRASLNNGKLAGLEIVLDGEYQTPLLQFSTFHRKGVTAHQLHSIATHPLGLTSLTFGAFGNKSELCQNLSLPSSSSSAEIILHAYQFWGEKCIERIRGNFVFAIGDARQNRLFLARSSLCHWILYYSFLPGGGFSFSTLLPPLVEWAGISKRLDKTKVANFLTLMTVDGRYDATFFSTIKKLPPGHTLELAKGQTSPVIKEFWSVGEVKKTPLSSKNYFADFRDLYKEVVKERISDGEGFCSQLSGGLDSSSVTCMAASILSCEGKELMAFSHIPTKGKFSVPKKNFNYDDTPFIEAVAAHWKNIRIHKIIDDHKRFFQDSELYFPWVGQPFLNPCNFLWSNLCIEEAKKMGLRKVLNGQTGNFTLSWIGGAVLSNKKLHLRQFLGQKKVELLKWRAGKTKKRPWGYFSAISDDLAEKERLLPAFEAENISEKYQSMEDPREKCFNGNSLDLIASYTTTMEFLHGIQLDDPTADIRVVEFCLRCPKDVFKNSKGSRMLVREAMGELMPSLVRHRTTKGMQAADWYKKIERQKGEIGALLEKWKKSPMEEYLNVSQLTKEWKSWQCQKVAESKGFSYCSYEMQYRIKLLRGLEVGLFIEPYI